MPAATDSPPEEARSSEHFDEAGATHRLRRGLISLGLLLALVIGLLLAVPGLHGVAHAVTHMQGGWVAVAVAAEVLSCVGYIVAFLQVFERAPIRLGARVALSELAFNAAVSLGGAGSVTVGAWLLIDRGAQPARVAERSAVLFLLTSAINVITLALIGLALFVGLLPGPGNPLLSLIPALVGVGVLVLFLALPRLSERGAARRAPGRLRTVLETTAQSIRDTRGYLFSPDWRTLGAVGYLWFDIGTLLACFAATGVNPPLAAVVLAYQIAYLSNLIPIPGGVGILDGSLVGMLVLYGASATASAAAVLVYHAISLWIPAMWGTAAFVMLRRSRNKPLVLRPSRAERRQRKAADG